MKKISLTQGKCALVDDADFDRLIGMGPWRYYTTPNRVSGYAVADIFIKGKRTTVRMHRVVTNISAGKVVDHINHDGLDNRRANLRICTQKENQLNRVSLNSNNTSGVHGVTWHRGAGKWMAQAMRGGKHIYLGVHARAETASLAVTRFIQNESSQP